MDDLLFKEHIINGLTPYNIYQGTKLKFSKINYFFGSNGSGKTLTLKNIMQNAKNTLNNLGKAQQGYFAQYISPAPQPFQDSYQIIDTAYQREQGGDLDPSFFYQHLSDHPEILIRIRDSIQRYLGRHPNIAKRGISNVMTFFRDNDEGLAPYSPTAESDGLRRLSLLLTYVYHPKCLFLAIDEPELHLHPDMISFLLEEVEEESKFGKQYFFATHSPEMIRIDKFEKYAYFYFDLKDKLKYSQIIDLNQTGAQDLMNELGFILDVNRRAFLFAPITLFVEGLKDEFVYSNLKIRKQVNWSRRVFMVNIGGCRNAVRFVKLWTKLNKQFRLILDNVSRSTSQDKDAISNTINELCTFFSIQEKEQDKQIKELEKHNIFIASYSDVCLIKKKNDNNCIYVDIKDMENSWDLYDFQEQVNILTKAIKTDEDIIVKTRDIEDEWLTMILSEITRLFSNSQNTDERLKEIKVELENKYPRLSITVNPNEENYLEGKYKVSDVRELQFIFSKDSAKHQHKASRNKM